MLLIFAYAPVLIILPILLVIAVVAVLVPGGFIVVLVGPYYLWCGFTWLLARAARARWRAARAKRRASPAHFWPQPLRDGAHGSSRASRRLSQPSPQAPGL
jgi:hypothetical protein